MADDLTHPYNRLGRVLTIDGVPDDVLLAIFDFYVVRYQDLGFRQSHTFGLIKKIKEIESWQSLVHVCRRWRYLVFGSPRRLDLQLYCRTRTFARGSLDVWPALPLLIKGGVDIMSVDNIISGLEYSDRIRHIDLECNTFSHIRSLWTGKLRRAMEVPFPELAALYLSFRNLSHKPLLPNTFLGGSVPCLRYLALTSIPFPGLPKLLLSATHLVQLWLHNIPQFGYISPEAMATCLSMSTSLEILCLEFEYPQSYPDPQSRRPYPPTRSVLPTLMKFSFKGLNEYLEEFVARIDAPQLYRLSTVFFNDVDFDTPELNQFIDRTPTLGAYDEAHLIFDFDSEEALVRLRQSHPERSDHRVVQFTILGEVSDRQLSILAKICTLPLRLLLTIENLYIDASLSPLDDIENTKWLDLLLPFTAVRNLYLSKPISPCIALALQELTGASTTEVFPALQNVLLEFQASGPVQEGIARFISARQLTNHSVAISVWDRNYLEEVDDW